MGEHEQHAAALRHHAPVHEPGGARAVVGRHFRGQFVALDGKRDLGQRRVGISAGVANGENQYGEQFLHGVHGW